MQHAILPRTAFGRMRSPTTTKIVEMNSIYRHATSIFLLCSGVAMAAPVIDVTKIAGKDAKQVAQILGSSKCAQTRYGPRCDYRNGGVEVVFIAGVADWITISNLEHVPFNADALNVIGLKKVQPASAMPAVIRWDSVPGFLSVSLFKGSVGSDYAYIKFRTK